VLQLEVSNDHQSSDKIDLGMHFHHCTSVVRKHSAGGNSQQRGAGKSLEKTNAQEIHKKLAKI
jgi:hypothetical protein